jgi:type IV secretion system protein VirB4
VKAPLNTCFAPHTFVDEECFVTKQKAYGIAYRLPGTDPECLTDETLENLAQQQLHASLRTLDEDFRVYQYVLKEKGCDVPYHRAAELYSIELYWILLLERSGRRSFEVEAGASLPRLRSGAEAFENSTRNFLTLERLNRSEVFRLMRRLTCLTRESADKREIPYTDHIDYWMGEHPIILDGKRAWSDRSFAVLTLKDLPRATRPNILGGLINLESDLILCSDFKRVPPQRAASLLADKQDHFEAAKYSKSIKNALRQARQGGRSDGIVADTSATENVDELGKAVKQVENHGEFLGEYSLTLLLHAPLAEMLNRPIADAKQIVSAAEGSLRRERFALDPYLAIIPGNCSRNFRRHYLTSANYADLSLIYAPAKGTKYNHYLKTEYLTVLETNQATPFDFSLFEDDLLGALVWGVMGSGKSFLCNLLIDRFQKYKPFTFILDIGNSYRHITKLHGGSYLALAQSGSYAMNPFTLERTPDNLDFLAAFVKTLIEDAGYDPTPKDCMQIDKAIKCAESLSDLDLSDNLKDCLYKWTGEGRHAHYFDNRRDSFESADFQAFEFRGVPKAVLGPLFLYIFHRISAIVHNPDNLGRVKALICDENWRFLRSRAGRDYFVEAGKTWRKDKGGIVLTTQSALDLKKVRLLSVINEICPTKILLHNPGADFDFYKRILKLNQRELDLCAGLTKKRQFFVKTPSYSKVLNVIVSDEEYWRYANDPESNLIRLEAQKKFGEDEGLLHLAKGA